MGDWQEGKPQGIICPKGQRVVVQPGRKKHRYLAYFDGEVCQRCPFVDQCSTKPHKRKPRRVPRFSQRDVSVAIRRKRSADVRAAGKNLRAGAESTMRSVKHPFRNGKLPVRGKSRMSMLVIASAAMTNIRRIHGYEEKLREADRKAKAIQKRMEDALNNIFRYFCGFVKRFLSEEFYPKMASLWMPV